MSRQGIRYPAKSLTVLVSMPTHTSMTFTRITSSASYYYRTLDTGPRRRVRK